MSVTIQMIFFLHFSLFGYASLHRANLPNREFDSGQFNRYLATREEFLPRTPFSAASGLRTYFRISLANLRGFLVEVLVSFKVS